MKTDQIMPVLYDLAMTMAGETRPYSLATSMLQRLMSHTGCSCGLLLLNPVPSADGKNIKALTYTAIGSPVLRALEGKNHEWPMEALGGEGMQSVQGWLPAGETSRYALRLELPGMGHILLFSNRPHENSIEQKSLLAPVMAKFASSLKHCLESDSNEKTLERSETRIRDILQSSPDWIWEATPHAILTFSNKKTSELLGIEQDEVLGRPLFEFMPQEEVTHFSLAFRDVVARRQAFHNLESIFLHRDGHEVVLETSAVPILDRKGTLFGYLGVSRDISERKKHERELLEARDKARASDRSKSLFLSSMSHEFRTPLNAVLGHAQLIGMQKDLPPETFSSAGEILQAGKVLLSLVSNVLELSRLSSDGSEIQIELFPVNDVVEAGIAQHAEAAASKSVIINPLCKCGRVMVEADRSALSMVLNQLIGNAVKYSPEGGEVKITCQNTGSGRTRILVTDNGPGIAAEDQKALFKPFDRAGKQKSHVHGSGVGLAIAKQLAAAMSGSVGLESSPGQGSTFWVEIPLAEPEDNSLSASSGVQAETLQKNLSPIRVLVAEDYAPNQMVIRIQLENLGCKCDISSNGEEALALWQKNPYDLLLTDLNMPVMDGLVLAREIREREANSDRHIPIVCITAAAVPSELEECAHAGMDDRLIKPIAMEDLRRVVERWGTKPDVSMPVKPASPAAGSSVMLDLEHLYSILGETNEEQARKLIATFIESADKGLAQLTSGSDPVLVSREMHKLKSSARTVGALRFAGLAETLEQQLREGRANNIPASLAAMREELAQVNAASASLHAPGNKKQDAHQALAGFGSVLVVDDDPVILQQMSAMLASLGANEALTAASGRDALKLLRERNAKLDALICDLNMPEMDGVELIRLFGRTGFKGGLILMSGADEKVLNTVGKLADLQGLNVLGQLLKPVMPAQIVSLLTQKSAPRVRKAPGSFMTEVSSQAIREGMERDEFTVWLQPKVDAGSLKPVGVEALARWQHPGRGIISPDVFISVAEREGLIRELSQILVSKALMEGAKLHEAGFPLTIALNLSGLWLDDLMLPDFILATTHAAKLRPRDVILEVTETGVMKDLTTALDVLTRLRLKGFGLSIDDFGIGYSSFEQLDRIPFTELKLDRSFVSKGAHDATARAILQSSMDMARRMSLSTVAEGVETENDLELVRRMGCDWIQGYLIAKPMPVEELTEWLKTR